LKSPLSFCIAGSGTAGLLSAIFLKKAFPFSSVTVVSSSEIGIIGVGEGSTEHWRDFMNKCDIPLLSLLAETQATHKYGIRFENWSNKFPDYFHSVQGDERIYAWGLFPAYMKMIADEKLLTNHTVSKGLFLDKISFDHRHNATNQFHFDTFLLNKFLCKLASRRGVKFIDSKIINVNLNSEDGRIESVDLDNQSSVDAEFWIDSTGFNRVLLNAVSDVKWKSFSDYLLPNSTFAFPTEKDPSGKVKTYTRAVALSSGWVWEIPTQQRRGNGYVYSSNHISDDDAIKEVSEYMGFDVTPARSFKFDPGHVSDPWVKNCVAVGLSSSFVEPLEATSIGSTIQSLFVLVPYLASYEHWHSASQRSYNKKFNIMMDNILIMIRLHYMSDRDDTQFWRDARNAKINDSLQELLDLWQETTLHRDFISRNSGEMFQIAHLLHVAQGMNLINTSNIDNAIKNLGLEKKVDQDVKKFEEERASQRLIDHMEALNEIY